MVDDVYAENVSTRVGVICGKSAVSHTIFFCCTPPRHHSTKMAKKIIALCFGRENNDYLIITKRRSRPCIYYLFFGPSAIMIIRSTITGPSANSIYKRYAAFYAYE